MSIDPAPIVQVDETTQAMEAGSVVSDPDSTTMDNMENTSTGSHSSGTKSSEIASEESRKVFRARVVVITILIGVAAAISTAVFLITKTAEQNEFQAQWQGNALQILRSFEKIVEEKFGAISILGVSFTAYARGNDQTWPFVTMNDLQEQAAIPQQISNAVYTLIMPIVPLNQREKWEEYSLQNKGWIDESRERLQALGLEEAFAEKFGPFAPVGEDSMLDFSSGIANKVFTMNTTTFQPIPSREQPNYYPIWQQFPPYPNFINANLFEIENYGVFIETCRATGEIVIGGCSSELPGNISSPNPFTRIFAFMLSYAAGRHVEYGGDPITPIFFPVFDSFFENRKQVAVLYAMIDWKAYFFNVLPRNVKSIVVILANSCEGPFTYIVDGPNVTFIAAGDLHSNSMNKYAQSVNLQDLLTDSINGVRLNQDVCQYNLTVYPTEEFYNQYNTSYPIYATVCVCVIFVVTCGVFFVYDRLVERRQDKVLSQAKKTSAIVSSLFPESVTKRLLADKKIPSAYDRKFLSPTARLQTFLQSHDNAMDQRTLEAKPIADMFPYTTVMFADIAGFTSWSSSRDPSHVFLLLETIYRAFDQLAAQHKVFKVETIGDSYVAVTGLPKPQERHALHMARFAWDCLFKFDEQTRELETTLGPDTTELGIRFGMHSGPVTAGVLRGEKSRFQLFGDTVNTAARMESTGVPGRIQVSQATANYLIALNKQHWLQRRHDSVAAKGKGVLETYWLIPHEKTSDHVSSSGTAWMHLEKRSEHISSSGPSILSEEATGSADASRRQRRIDWIVSIMCDRIREIVARNEALQVPRDSLQEFVLPARPPNSICLDETVDILQLPKFDAKTAVQASKVDPTSIEIPKLVVDQLQSCIASIANTYRDNHFHNFEHACHVTMCVDKFLKRIVAPDVDTIHVKDQTRLATALHDYTHGINSDPLTILAILFSALVHDADHRGVSNVQLAKEDEGLWKHYRGKSLAEQNSLDLTWDIFMSNNYQDLRAYIFANKGELQRFRQVMVNVVLATDIFDQELNHLRKCRWDRAFSSSMAFTTTMSPEDNDKELFGQLRATVVTEHIIQASDVCHTMQHWHIYRKWNERLFLEMHDAYQKGRRMTSTSTTSNSMQDPATSWYHGELAFFDNYVIPLAKKLKECRVFGVSSDECLNYAIQNRAEWQERGQGIVQQLMKKADHSSTAVTFDTKQ